MKCACGCGGEAKEGNRFINGHYIRVNNPMNNPEYRDRVSESRLGDKHPFFGKKRPDHSKRMMGENNPSWTGGKKIANKRHHLKRNRALGFIPINEPLHIDDEVAHHLTIDYVAYIPEFINKSINHCVESGLNMDEVNFYALNYLFLVYNKEN